MRSGKAQAVTPMSFFQVAVDRNPNVCIDFILKRIKQCWKPTGTKLFRYPTLKNYRVKAKGKHFLLVSDTSDSTQYSEVRILEEEEEDADADSLTSQTELVTETSGTELELYIGDWVAVRYYGDIFPGEITDFGHTLSADVNLEVIGNGHNTMITYSMPEKMFLRSLNL